MRKALTFVALTLLLSWPLGILFTALMRRQGLTPGLFAIPVLYMFMPAVAVIIVQKAVRREPIIRPLDVSFRLNGWWLVAWLLPPLMAAAAFGVSLLLPGVRYSPEMAGMFDRFGSVLTPDQLAQMRAQVDALPIHPFWLGLFQGLVAGVSINAVAAFGEELGWRGLLQKELAFLGFWRSALLIGFIWGVWHAPLILAGHNYPQHPVTGVAMMTAWCLLLSPLLAYVRLRAGSVIAAAVMHGSLNGTGGLSIVLVAGGSDLTVGLTGLAGFIVLAVLNLALFLALRRSSTPTSPTGDQLSRVGVEP